MDDYYNALGTSIPDHVKRRIAAALGTEPTFIVGKVRKTDSGREGTLVAFNADLVALAELSDSPYPLEGQEWRGGTSVQVAAWRRDSLQILSIPDSPGNSDYSWQEMAWPKDSVAELTYSSGRQVRLESDWYDENSVARMRELLGSLPNDLRRRVATD